MSDKIYDVLQVGYGPVSQALAMMLGNQGRSVGVLERWNERYPLPRAAGLDHEINRMLCANGLREIMPSISHPLLSYRWYNAEWKQLLSFEWPDEDVSGGSTVLCVHQPTFEAAMDNQVKKFDSINVMLGWEVLGIRQQADCAVVHARHAASGEERDFRARYVVGCDGANSLVREEMVVTRRDHGFDARWLVVDVLLRNGKTAKDLDIPDAAQWCNPARPTTIVPSGVRNGEFFRRWEFYCMPHEADDEMESEGRIWELLSHWGGPEQFEIVRHRIYRFRSLTAETWRKGRILLAGDAAHVMPPFMAQGLCSGLRDAWNLAWKLALVLDGKADDRLLDLYEAERKPHVQQMIDISVFLGKVICVPDPKAAAERDAAFFAGEAPPPPAFPHLTGGLVRRDAKGAVRPGSGLLAPAGITFTGPLDDLIGLGWVVFRASGAPRAASPANQGLVASLGMRDFEVPSGREEPVYAKIRDFMAAQGWQTMIVRPDFYAYGGASAQEGPGPLLDDLGRDLAVAGLRLS
nr:C573 [uncultured bacterium]